MSFILNQWKEVQMSSAVRFAAATATAAPACTRSGDPMSLAAGTLVVAPDGLSARFTFVRQAGPAVALAVSLHTGGVWRLDNAPDAGAPHPRFRIGDISLVAVCPNVCRQKQY